MATTLAVGQSLPLTIKYLDQLGNEMATAPTPDTPPAWTQSNSAAETLTPAADGLSAEVAAVAEGEDTVSLSLAVAGLSFSASLAVTVHAVAPPAQVLTSIEIVPGTPTP